MVALPDSFWADEEDTLLQLLLPLVTQAGTAGAQAALDDLAGSFGAGVDWALVNTDVQAWAGQYTAQLVTGITQTTQTFIQQAIDTWIGSGAPLPDLIDALTPAFGQTRAELIGVTEVTRAFHEGSVAAWRDAGFVEKWRFNTAQDDTVCPICAPLDGKEFPLDEESNAPPVHPRCRCWSQPVVALPSQ